MLWQVEVSLKGEPIPCRIYRLELDNEQDAIEAAIERAKRELGGFLSQYEAEATEMKDGE